jgi:hypothetical protein
VPELLNGDPDVISTLYSDEGLKPSIDGTRDPFKIAKVNSPDIVPTRTKNLTEEIKVLIPEGLRDPLSVSAGQEARLCIGREGACDTAYKVKIRAMITKFPGFQLFTSYQSAQFASQ